MASLNSIILPSGISAVPPITNAVLPKWVIGGASPALTDSIVREVPFVGPPARIAIVIGTDPNPTASETLRFSGGLITEGRDIAGVVQADSVSIGRGATVTAASIAIGTGAVSGGSGITIGFAAITGGSFAIAIGNSAIADRTSCMAIGPTSAAQPGFGGLDALAIGAGAQALGSSSTVIGSSAGSGPSRTQGIGQQLFGGGVTSLGTGFDILALGGNHGAAAANATGAIAIGRTAPVLGAHICTLGGIQVNNYIDVIVLGQGDTQSIVRPITVRCTNRSGTDVVASPVNLVAPRGTGAAASTPLVIQAGVPGGAGAAQHAVGDAAAFDGTTTATHTRLLVWDVDTATLARVTVGAANSGGAGFKLLRIPN